METKTKRKYTTKKMRVRRGMIKGALGLIAAYFLISGTYQIGSAAYSSIHSYLFDWPDMVIDQVMAQKPENKSYEVISETIREITAYNVGDHRQTDNSPCIGAYSKVNLCEQVAKGKKVCAANFVPLGTELLITAPNGWNFHCIVWDRMARKHAQRVDIAMNLWEKDRAIKFGLQNLTIKILK